MAQDMYGQPGAQPGAEAGTTTRCRRADAHGGESKKDDDDVVDADFKEV
jgi:hypothetical protein